MRIVLVNWASDTILGDTAEFAKNSAEWADCTFCQLPLEQLAVVAVRLFDESEGRYGWRYQFACFGKKEISTYEIFTVNEEEEEAVFRPGVSSISAIMTRCAYAGFVRRTPPARHATLPTSRAA